MGDIVLPYEFELRLAALSVACDILTKELIGSTSSLTNLTTLAEWLLEGTVDG
jgi:hypothetical protein